MPKNIEFVIGDKTAIILHHIAKAQNKSVRKILVNAIKKQLKIDLKDVIEHTSEKNKRKYEKASLPKGRKGLR